LDAVKPAAWLLRTILQSLATSSSFEALKPRIFGLIRRAKKSPHNRLSEPTRSRLNGNSPIAQDHKAETDHNYQQGEWQHPQIQQPSGQSEAVEALRAIVNERIAARAQDQADEKRWWPPDPEKEVKHQKILQTISTTMTTKIASPSLSHHHARRSLQAGQVAIVAPRRQFSSCRIMT
jgi:hypothetical protein